MRGWCWLAGVVLAISGCSTTQVAPIVDMTGGNTKSGVVKQTVQPLPVPGKIRDWRPLTHTVQKGETLYSIALEYGLDYKDLATWNSLGDVNHILLGQSLRLTAPAESAIDNKVQVVPLKPPAIVTQPLIQPMVIISQPQAVKLPYSAAAVAQVSRSEEAVASKPVVSTPVVTMPTVSPALPQTPVIALTPAIEKPVSKEATNKEADDVALDWIWPTKGRVIAEFSEVKASKGIDISGIRGQTISASAAGKVVYAGSGLRGYGKLVIIKHNAIYLTAYAHNQQIMVKEGQAVTQGQKIAEMGDSDADQVMLHFEVRQMGKPVDPLKFLPEGTK